MANEEETIAYLSAMEKEYEEEYGKTLQDIARYNQLIEDQIGAERFIENFERSEGKEVLLPLGEGILLPSQTKRSAFIIHVGGSYYIEANKEKALAILNQNIAKLKEYAEKLALQAQEIRNEITKIVYTLGMLSNQRGKNV
ncbi:MAG: prefoldin subunit alpha [Candidatus Micrarchaeaceae archaeon]